MEISHDRLGVQRPCVQSERANGRNPISIMVPCHRVIGSNGKLTGFAGGLETKALLLKTESGKEHL